MGGHTLVVLVSQDKSYGRTHLTGCVLWGTYLTGGHILWEDMSYKEHFARHALWEVY